MYSSISKLDRDIARSFLNAPTDMISYRSVPMKNEQQNHMISMMAPFQSDDYKENLFDDFVPPPHPNAQLAYPTNTNTIPMYYDVIIDTVTDYDILYPIAKQTKKYYSDESISNENSIYPRYHVKRLEELAVSIDFPHDYESISNASNHLIDTSSYHDEYLQPIKNVRFDDNPIQIPSSKNITKNSSIPIDQYYFHPDTSHPSSLRCITTPFFWFRPVLNNNYAICIPTTRPSLYAYLTSSYDPQNINNPIRL